MLLLSFYFAALCCVLGDNAVYVVYMGGKENSGTESILAAQHNMLATALGSEEDASSSFIYKYKHAFSGFSARLTSLQANKISEMPGVVSVFRSRKLELHTTESWQFLGLTDTNFKQIWEMGNSDDNDVIVGVLDTGIWPESESFRDHGMGPVPKRWKGLCENTDSLDLVHCNRKVIGIRSYYPGSSAENASSSDYKNGRDSDGHGTHTASTAAGRLVKGASLFGLCKGNARGGMPKARIAVYKVCFSGDCHDHSVLAAFDDAINDGVDILSVSLGGGSVSFHKDVIAIGSFHAMKRGILVSASAGNSGPFSLTVSNGAPWILTVGASSTKRRLRSCILLGDGSVLQGTAINIKSMNNESYGLVYGGDAARSSSLKNKAKFCRSGTLNPSKVKAKIIVCVRDVESKTRIGNSSTILKDFGAAGMIQINELVTDVAFSFSLPVTLVTKSTGVRLLSYLNSTSNPTAVILPTETIIRKNSDDPFVSVFSSRGPNRVSPEILKPDIVAPGLNILAAWSPSEPAIKNMPPTLFNVISGTSMSCPHATGAIAYIKSLHPEWSPSMIKSALLTTASVQDASKKNTIKDYNGKEAVPFDYGAGQMNLLAAANPGLVYDISTNDYVSYLCSMGYKESRIRLIAGVRAHCKDEQKVSNLNYPTITISNFTGHDTVTRDVINVGDTNSTYNVSVDAPEGFSITVQPEKLVFGSDVKSLSYTVHVTRLQTSGGSLEDDYAFGSLSWLYGNTQVRSIIVIGSLSIQS